MGLQDYVSALFCVLVLIDIYYLMNSTRFCSSVVSCTHSKLCSHLNKEKDPLEFPSVEQNTAKRWLVLSQRQQAIRSIDRREVKAADAFALFEPEWTCPWELRIGKLGDGGKWICSVSKLRENDSVQIFYSLGSARKFSDFPGEDSFELEAHQRWPMAEIYVLDPDPSYAKSNVPYHVYAYAIGPKDTDSTITIQSFANGASHETIDVLKMDIERAEWTVLPALLKSAYGPKIFQLIIEFHFDKSSDLDSLLTIMKLLEESGYVLFHKENSLHNVHGTEMSFIHVSQLRDYVH